MLEALKDDELVRRLGGPFRLTALIQRRLKELIEGARPMVDATGKTMVEVAVEEIATGKIAIDYEHSEGLMPPDEAAIRTEIHVAAPEPEQVEE